MYSNKKHGVMKLGIALFIFFGLIGAPTVVYGIGVTPSTVELKNVPSNTKLERFFYVARGNPSEDQEAKITVSGDAAQYISLKQGGTVPLPKGETLSPVYFIVNTNDLPAGTYRAEISVTPFAQSKSNITGSAGSGIVAGATALVVFTVTNEVIQDFEVLSAEIGASEEGLPFGFTFQLNNRGNVAARPTKAVLTVLDENNKDNQYSETIEESRFELVKPFEIKSVNIETNAKLVPGLYRGTLQFYNGESLIFTKENSFQVYPRGTLAQKGELVSFLSDKNEYKQGESIKFSGELKNTGEIAIAGTLVVELFRNNERIDVLKTGEAFILPNQIANLELFYKIEKGGSYKARAAVSYGPFKTAEQEIQFNVPELNILLIVGILCAILIAVAVILLIIRKRKNAFHPPNINN